MQQNNFFYSNEAKKRHLIWYFAYNLLLLRLLRE